MTREEAKNIVAQQLSGLLSNPLVTLDEKYVEAEKMAIEALNHWIGMKEVLDKIRAEIEALPKTYPFVNHYDMYVKEDDVKKIIDKYIAEGSEDK